MNKTLCAFLVMAGLGVLGLMMIPGSWRLLDPANSAVGLANQPSLVTHTEYTVQEIDGCEYILYRVYVDESLRSYRKYECRMIHSASCENHGLARELKEQF